MSRWNADFGSRGELHDRDTIRFVAGFDGNFQNGWRYEVAANYGRLDTRMRSLNNLVAYDLDGNLDGFLLAIDAVRNSAGEIVCSVNADADSSNDRPDCVPINVFGSGAPSQAALDFVNTTGTRDERAEQFVVSAYVSGDLPQFRLPAGSPGFALGAEYRSERAWSVFDDLSAAGATFQNAILPFHPPDLSIKEVYAELRLPLLRDRRLAHELTAEAAGRISDYNNSMGSVGAWNVGLVYSPVSELALRANYSTSVRAPTQGDLFRPLSQDFTQVHDPCDVRYIDENPHRAANCAAHHVPSPLVNDAADRLSARRQSVAGRGRRRELHDRRPLHAPVPGRPFTRDRLLRHRSHDLIAPPSAQAILNACYDSPSGVVGNPFCEVINRYPDGKFKPIALIATGFNYARQVTEGVDLDLTYTAELRNGHRLSARMLATRVFELNNYLDPEDPGFADRALGELGVPGARVQPGPRLLRSAISA